jgi:hypothetical protein
VTEPRTPAPFTHAQVDALVRGKLAERDVVAVLEAHAAPTPRGKRRRATKLAPAALEATELQRLREEGVTPREVARRLDEAAKKDQNKAAEIDETADRPTKKPRLQG